MSWYTRQHVESDMKIPVSMYVSSSFLDSSGGYRKCSFERFVQPGGSSSESWEHLGNLARGGGHLTVVVSDREMSSSRHVARAWHIVVEMLAVPLEVSRHNRHRM